MSPPRTVAEWTNSLIWGDNKYILASLIAGDPAIGLEPLAGKVDLIYIDPPFASGQDFSYQVRVGDETWRKEANLLEEKAYRDTWGKGMESYLTIMHERLLLARDLLSPTGSMYLHCDDTALHYLKLLMDSVFGAERYRNAICWKRTSTHNDSGKFGRVADFMLLYGNADINVDAIRLPLKDDYVKKFYRHTDERGAYQSQGLTAEGTTRGESGQPWRGINPGRHGNHWRPPRGDYGVWIEENVLPGYMNIRGVMARLDALDAAGLIAWPKKEGGVPRLKRYIVSSKGQAPTNIWDDISPVSAQARESTPYPTQKPEALLERVIKASSNEGDLVLDFFAGSGTTLAVAEKLGRRWIGCDLSRYAIQVTRKRMLDIEGCRPFQLLNLGRYERRHWQVNVLNGDKPPERAAAEYYRFIVALYQAEAVGGHRHLHGRKTGRYVHVGPADAPVTRDETMDAVRECAANRIGGLDILGWEWELGLHDTIIGEARAEGVDVRLLVIPREVMDRRAGEKGDVQFHELAYLKTSLETSGMHVVVRLDDFIIPNPELVPDEVRSRIKKWSDYIDFWAVDWNYGAAGEGDVFHNEWQTYRTRSAPALILLSEPHVYDAPGTRRILVKVIDIFGNDATQLREVELR